MSNQLRFGFVDTVKKLDVQNRLVSVTESRAFGGTYQWGKSGSFPQELIELVYGSLTARRCVEVRENFIYADGFVNKDDAEFMANPDQTADQLLAEIASYQALHAGFALIIKQNLTSLSEISSVRCVPIGNITRKINGNFLINPRRRGQSVWRQTDDVEYLPYDQNRKPNLVGDELKRQIKLYNEQIGTMLFVYTKKPGQEFYPTPGLYSAYTYMRAEAEYGKIELNKVANGLFSSGIIETPPLSTDLQIDIKGEEIPFSSEKDLFDRDLRSMTGSEAAGGFIHIQNRSNGERQIGTKMTPLNPVGDALDYASKGVDIAKKICRSAGVPPVLAQIDALSGIGDTKQIVDEITYFNFNINKEQAIIQGIFKKLWPDSKGEWIISSSTPIKYFTPEMFATLSKDEIRNLAGFAPSEKTIPNESEKTLAALDSLSPLMASKVLDSMSVDEIRALVGLAPKVIENIQPITGS